jgi:heme/copper-type cytochrome/quinol oxidase subunit 4
VNPEIVEYISRNRDAYTREAITEQLLSAGYAPVEIAAAWRNVEGTHFSDEPTPHDPQGTARDPRKAGRFANSPRFWAILIGFILLSYLVPGLLIYTGFVEQGLSGLATFGVVFFLALQLFGLIVGFLNMKGDRATGMGLLISVLTVVVLLPCLGVAALYGICFGGSTFG